MVGLVIGLLATLVVLQVFSIFEAQKRTTSGTADVQTSGNVALFTIKRDLEMAGYGLLPVATNPPLSCTSPVFDNATGPTPPMTTLSPVTITDGGTGPGASDTITIRYGTSNSGGGGSIIGTAIGTAGANTASVNDNQSCHVGDIAIVINGTGAGQCTLAEVTALSAPPDYTGIALSTGILNGTSIGANLSCLGTWHEIQYGINPNYNPAVPANSLAFLQRQDTSFPTPASGNPGGAPIVADIVNIQAQYGISNAASSNQIIRWVNAKDQASWNAAVDGPATGIDWGPSLTDANRNLIKAVRIAVVARSGLLEKTQVTSACTSLTSDAPTGLCAWAGSSSETVPLSPAPAINMGNDPNWQYYRYRVFETIVPLRNVIWSK